MDFNWFVFAVVWAVALGAGGFFALVIIVAHWAYKLFGDGADILAILAAVVLAGSVFAGFVSP